MYLNEPNLPVLFKLFDYLQLCIHLKSYNIK